MAAMVMLITGVAVGVLDMDMPRKHFGFEAGEMQVNVPVQAGLIVAPLPSIGKGTAGWGAKEQRALLLSTFFGDRYASKPCKSAQNASRTQP